MLEKIRDIIEGVSTSYGEEFTNNIMLSLNKAINADYTFIAQLNEKQFTAQTIGLVAKGQLIPNMVYSLENTPCANVIENTVCCYSKAVCKIFPKDQLLIDMHIQAYLGTPLHNSKQQVMGLIVALYEQPINDEDEALALFQVFSGRIAAELERREHENSLEQTVASRTKELSATVKKMQIMQKQLIESEKMAALGDLVAGISHEVNTPLGIAITTHSLMHDEHKQLTKSLSDNTLSKKAMQHYQKAVENALNLQGENLARAKKLIENFKETAADQHQLEIEMVNISDYYHRVISTLHSLIKTKKVTLSVDCYDDIEIATYPGIHAQIITNLISNSIRHGFNQVNKNHENQIKFTINKADEDIVQITYQDNGIGLSEEAKTHVFEPFYTTARDKGGVGLGMSIIYNLINQKLDGNITYKDTTEGACFIYQFKTSQSAPTV